MHRLRLLFQKYLNLGVRPHFVQTVIERAEHSVIGWNSNTSAVRTKKLRMEKAVYDAERALEFEVARMQAHQRRQNWHQIAHSAVAGFGDPNYEAHLRHLINTADDGQVAMQIRHLVRARQVGSARCLSGGNDVSLTHCCTNRKRSSLLSFIMRFDKCTRNIECSG